MATQKYFAWDDLGRPWRRATPIAELEAWARANNIAVLGTIGNEEHLTANTPQDHTPFSYTAWPVPLDGYVVTAIDLANVNGLGQAIEDNARAGKLPWLKYMNHSGQHLDSRDLDGDGKVWEEYPSSDHHVHLSIRTDYQNRSIIGSFDPWGKGVSAMFCKFGDSGENVIALQSQLLQVDPASLPQFGADGGYGNETANALSRLVTGGDGRTYQGKAWAKLQALCASKVGGQPGPKGDKGDPGEPGKVPTQVTFGPVNATVTAVS